MSKKKKSTKNPVISTQKYHNGGNKLLIELLAKLEKNLNEAKTEDAATSSNASSTLGR
jgi:hypothetical protein